MLCRRRGISLRSRAITLRSRRKRRWASKIAASFSPESFSTRALRSINSFSVRASAASKRTHSLCSSVGEIARVTGAKQPRASTRKIPIAIPGETGCPVRQRSKLSSIGGMRRSAVVRKLNPPRIYPE